MKALFQRRTPRSMPPRRAIALGAVGRLLAQAAVAQSLAAAPASGLDLTTAERAAFGAELRAYLLTHPEVIPEALSGAEAKRQATHAARDIALLQAHSETLFHAPGDWTGGAVAGDLTLVSFIDYRDPASARALAAAQQLARTDGNLTLVVKEAPAEGTPEAERAARFALTVRHLAGDDAYLRAQTALFDAADSAPETLAAIAIGLGLDPKQVAAGMAAPAITAKLHQTRSLMQTLDLGPAPAQVLDRTMVRGDVPAVALARILDALRRPK